jgi:hypothetical protein
MRAPSGPPAGRFHRHLHAVAALALGAVQRLVGAPQRGIEGLTRADQRHTDADGHVHRPAVDGTPGRGRHRLAQSLGSQPRAAQVVHRHQHDEFLATETR